MLFFFLGQKIDMNVVFKNRRTSRPSSEACVCVYIYIYKIQFFPYTYSIYNLFILHIVYFHLQKHLYFSLFLALS